MDRWSGVFKIPMRSNGNEPSFNVAASLCLCSTSHSLAIPQANAIFFSGDRVTGTGNPVIERLSDLQNIADILVTKLGGFVNAWVIEASVFNGPFAVYKDFVPSVNQRGEPKSYDPTGFPASESTVAVLSIFLRELKSVTSRRTDNSSLPTYQLPKTYVFGFSKGGTVLNQLVSELGFFNSLSGDDLPDQQTEECRGKIVPDTREALLRSIAEMHYLDVGLNAVGAYITDGETVERIARHQAQLANEKEEGIRFVLHGTPRQWCDSRRPWIRDEKDKLVRLLQTGAQTSGGKLQVLERFYFAEKQPDLQMHFEIIEKFDVNL